MAAMRVQIYNIKKKVNSTALPSNLLTTVDFVYKDAQSSHNPTIIINKQSIKGWNYAKIDGSYFWINDIVYAGNHIELSLNIDVLATYRSEIFATTAFISRAKDGSIYQIDSMNPPTVDIIEKKEEYDINYFSEIGSYLISVAGGTTSSGGGLATQYVLNDFQLGLFMETIFSDTITNAWKNYWDTVFETWSFSFDPFEWILNCRWLPINTLSWPGLVQTTVKLGRFDTYSNAYLNPGEFLTGTIVIPITIPKNAFFSSQYYDMSMYLPFYGITSIPIDSIYNLSNMYLHYAIDTANGDIVYSLTADENATRLIGTWGACCATNMPISAAQTNFSGTVGAVAAVLGLVGAVATGGASAAIGAAAGLAGSAVGNAISQATQLSVQTNGSLSSRIGIALGNKVRITTRYHVPVSLINENASTIGLPYNHNAVIGNLSGYVKTIGASVAADATQEELVSIDNYLDGGVFIE